MKGFSSAGIGIFTAIVSSLCCTAPLVAILAGSSSVAANFQWVEPLRPWLISATVLALGIAWFQRLRPRGKDDCECEIPRRSIFGRLPFLSGVTLFAVLMLAFPLYAELVYPGVEPAADALDNQSQIEYVELAVTGMTCAGCEAHVELALSEIEGVIDAKASYRDADTKVHFDASQTDVDKITRTIESTGYKVQNATINPSQNHQ